MRELLQKALQEIESLTGGAESHYTIALIQEIKAALAQPDDPVAWMVDSQIIPASALNLPGLHFDKSKWKLLYTHQQPERKPLSDSIYAIPKLESVATTVEPFIAPVEQHDPVAYIVVTDESTMIYPSEKHTDALGRSTLNLPKGRHGLYLHPQPERKPLTEDDISDACKDCDPGFSVGAFAQGVLYAELYYGIKEPE